MKFSKKKIKDWDIWDIKLMNAGIVFLTFFALLIIPWLMNWLHNQNKWLMLIIAIVLFARPCHKFWKK